MKGPRSGPTLSALRETLRSNKTSRGPLTGRAVRNRPRSEGKRALRRRGGALGRDQAITGATIGNAKAGENLCCTATQASGALRWTADCALRTATPALNSGKRRYPAALYEFESRFLKGPQRSVNRKVQGSNPWSGAKSDVLIRLKRYKSVPPDGCRGFG